MANLGLLSRSFVRAILCRVLAHTFIAYIREYPPPSPPRSPSGSAPALQVAL